MTAQEIDDLSDLEFEDDDEDEDEEMGDDDVKPAEAPSKKRKA